MALSKEILEAQLSSVVGSENLVTEEDLLQRYSKDQSFVPPRVPLYAVQPKTIEEIQEIVRISNQSKIPITPYSSGKNNQGAAVPSYGGIVIDLSRMNAIFEIDETSRVATIEPGVTFDQLQDEAHKHGLRVCTPVELPGSACVLSTYAGLIPLYSWPRYGTEFLLSMKIVLPTADILSTGGAVYPSVKKPYDSLNVVGSFLNKIWFGSQGTLGIISWGTTKLKTLYEGNKVFFIPFDRAEDAFDPMRKIAWNRIGEEVFVLNRHELALILADKIPEDVVKLSEVLSKEMMVVVIRGPIEQAEFQEEDLKDACAGFRLNLETDLANAKKAGNKILKEIEHPKGHEKTSKYKGARNTIPFITLLEKIPEYDKAVQEIAVKYKYPKGEIGRLILPAEIGRVYCQYSFGRDPADPEGSKQTQKMFYEASERLMEMGAFFAWPYGSWGQEVYGRAEAYHLLIKKFKQIVDPNNIMNPGKLAL